MKTIKQSEAKQLRLELLKKQDGLCLLCKKESISPHLDHQHKKRLGGTGLIRGVICRGCNLELGKIENNAKRNGISLVDLPVWLRCCADYLKLEHLQILHFSEVKKPKKLKKSSYNKLMNICKVWCEYPKSGRLTKKLKKLFGKYGIEPEFYK